MSEEIINNQKYLDDIRRKPKETSLWVTALAASIGLHAVGLYFLTSHPMMLHYSLRSLFSISTPAPEYLENQEDELAKKNHVVEEVFDHILVLSSHLQQPFDLVELPRSIAIAPSDEIFLPISSVHEDEQIINLIQNDTLSSQIFALDIQTDTPCNTIICATQDRSSFDMDIQVAPYIASYDIDQIALPEDTVYVIDPMTVSVSDLAALQEPEGDTSLIARQLIPRFLSVEQIPWKIEEKSIELDLSLGTHKLNEQVPFFSHPALTKMHAPRIHIDPLENVIDDYLPSSLHTTAQWNEDFDLNISFLPNSDGKGYIFSLSLMPNFDISQYSLKHDVLFIIDRSVRKHRFEIFKRSVIKALASLQQTDSFNIYIIDKKMTRFNVKSLPVNQKTIRAAEHFLEKQSEEALFAQGDIYTSLEKILPEIQDDENVHSAILITDGVSQLSTRKQQQLLKNWIEKNDGKLSVYTAAVGQNNDLLMLDFLSSISGGKLLWSDTHAAFPRKLAKLVLDLRDPIATDLIIDAIAQHADCSITLASSSFQAPVLFSHQPYVIFGSIDNPGPFDLIIQGRHRDQWIAIKKTISFMEGAKADRTLLNKWSALKARHAYAKFLNDGKPANLKEAKEILKKSGSQIALQ